MTRLLKRLRRRGRRYQTWRIVFSDDVGVCEVMVVVRNYRPTRKARASLRSECSRFEIEQMASASRRRVQDVGVFLLCPSKHHQVGQQRGGRWPEGGGPISRLCCSEHHCRSS